MIVPSTEARPLRGILLTVLAISLFSFMTALVKAAERVPAGEAMFFRSVVAIPALLVWYGLRGEVGAALGTTDWKGHARRGIVGSLAMGLGFAGLKYLPLPEVTALRFVTPILIVVFAAVMLGERIRLIRISAVAAGLLGVGIILAPRISVGGSVGEMFGAGVVLASAACAAFAQIFIKRMSGTETASAIVFYFALTASALSLLTLPFGWVWPVGVEWVYLLGAGVIGLGGQIMMTSAYSHADAGVLAPFTYVSMLWAVGIGWAAFGEVPTFQMLLGAALIIGASVAIAFRERQLGLRRAAEAKVRAKGMQ